MGILSIVVKIFGVVAKLAPLLFAYGAGKRGAQKKQLEKSLKNVKESNEVSQSIKRLDVGSVLSKLRNNWRRG
mgnify:CR=1 FL=1|tara:strand:+ start:298 stop:516 length:219 start_codon:yes stop_codon:yes gene_type:complete